MKLCLDCGRFYDESKCVCGSDCYEKAIECALCGEYFGKSELMDGICEDCVKKEMTVQNTYEYIEENGEFAYFMIRHYYGVDEYISLGYNPEANADFKALFEQKTKTKDLSKLCKEYVFEDLENFAEWLAIKYRKEVF